MKRIGLAAVLAFGITSVAAQQIGSLDAPREKPKQYVEYAAEEQTVKAGRAGVLELNFHVAQGYHVNSHTPNSEFLLPTKLDFQASQGVQVGVVEYPAGTAYSFSFEPKEKLDVYSGGFSVRVPVVAQAGAHEVDGTLRYQACDRGACYPPKTLPVRVVFTAK